MQQSSILDRYYVCVSSRDVVVVVVVAINGETLPAPLLTHCSGLSCICAAVSFLVKEAEDGNFVDNRLHGLNCLVTACFWTTLTALFLQWFGREELPLIGGSCGGQAAAFTLC